MAQGSQEHGGLIFGGRHHFRVPGLYEKRQRIPLRVPFLVKRSEGNEHVIVLGLAESASDGCRYADYLVTMRAHADHLSDGVHVEEKLLGDIGSDVANR